MGRPGNEQITAGLVVLDCQSTVVVCSDGLSQCDPLDKSRQPCSGLPYSQLLFHREGGLWDHILIHCLIWNAHHIVINL